MADPDYNPLDPQSAQPPPGPNQGTGPGLADQWRGFLAEPSNRAFLIQTGLQMMQPVPVGQSTVGHIAASIGGGGEAAQNVQQGEERRQEKESIQQARQVGSEAKLQVADAALQRSAASQLNADTRARLGASGGRDASGNSLLQARIRAQTAFNAWAGKDNFGMDDPYLDALGVPNKAEAIKRYNSDPAFRAQVLDTFGGMSSGNAEAQLLQQAREALKVNPSARPEAERILRSKGIDPKRLDATQ